MAQTDQKIVHILDAALPVFVRFGFRKTSMADIAKAAGISRASLYLSFNSKEELFRAGSTRAHAETMAQVERVLSGEGSAVERIEKAVTAFQQGLIAPFGGSTEVEELFAANRELASDIALEARTKLLRLLTDTFETAVATKEIEIGSLQAGPSQLASVVLASLEGIKDANGAGAVLANGTGLFMRLLKAAVCPATDTGPRDSSR